MEKKKKSPVKRAGPKAQRQEELLGFGFVVVDIKGFLGG
jgi:hypothetical protein